MRDATGRTFPDTLQNTVRCRPISGCAGLIASKTVRNANQASVSPFFSFPFSFLFFSVDTMLLVCTKYGLLCTEYSTPVLFDLRVPHTLNPPSRPRWDGIASLSRRHESKKDNEGKNETSRHT